MWRRECFISIASLLRVMPVCLNTVTFSVAFKQSALCLMSIEEQDDNWSHSLIFSSERDRAESQEYITPMCMIHRCC